MENKEIKQLLVKYITGEANETDTAQIKQWISAHPENEQYFVELYDAWQNLLHLRTDFINEEEAYQRFKEKAEPVPQISHRSVNSWYAIAASIFLCIAIGWMLLIRHNNPSSIEMHQIAAHKGDIKKVVLGDGTWVWLNAASTLTYKADFGKVTRTVYLEGEAMFDIAAGHKNIPFIIHTKNYIIRDIGTRFNVKSYASDSSFEAAVIKGEISVESNADNGATEMNRILLKPNQILNISNRSTGFSHIVKNIGHADETKTLNDIQIQQVAAAQLNQYDGWTNNELIFEDKPLAEIARILERRYNVNIVLENNELQSIRYTGCFKNIESIDVVLNMIKENTPVSFSRKGDNITITKTQ